MYVCMYVCMYNDFNTLLPIVKCTHKNGHIPFLKSHFSDTTFLRLSGDIPGKWTPYFYKNPVFRTQYFKFVSDDVKYNQVEVYTHD